MGHFRSIPDQNQFPFHHFSQIFCFFEEFFLIEIFQIFEIHEHLKGGNDGRGLLEKSQSSRKLWEVDPEEIVFIQGHGEVTQGEYTIFQRGFNIQVHCQSLDGIRPDVVFFNDFWIKTDSG